MQVCVPSNAAQIFHLLRRQMLRPYRKPLVVFTPKSLLRMKEASSPIEALANEGFKTIIPESESFSPESAQRLIFCTGKVYYDLVAERQARGIEDIAIVRIEQLYPFPKTEMAAEIERYAAKVKDILWVQEEPKNQGYWFWIEPRINQFLSGNHKVRYVGRASSASPAVGYYSIHMQQQKQLVDEALSF
jgi:2-oxoglutarate dehydrogenase E1 component